MKEWLTAREIAAENLPDLPSTKQGVNLLAERNRWNSHPSYCRAREDRGGGLEYHYRLFPTLAQVTYVQRHMVVGAVEPAQPVADQQAPVIAGRPGEERDARLAIIAAFETFSRGLRLNRDTSAKIFCDKYEMGSILVDPWVKEKIPHVSSRTLWRWLSIKRLGKVDALAVDRSKARAGTGLLDTANGGMVKDFILGLMVHAPQLSGAQVRDQIEFRFGPTLTKVSKGVECQVPLPPVRTIQAFLQDAKERYAVELTKLTNPDKFRSTMALSGVGTLRHITHANALWQIDASPVDALCTDGRHSIYALIDIATRRTIFYVTRTPRATAVALLIRRGILKLGKPETIKTDNGSDFVALEIKRLFLALGIQIELSDAYSPQQKGHVERVIKTFQHQFAQLLPGYVGHSVAERKTIEDRKSFADRLGQDTAEAFDVSLTGAQLQEAVDRWAETVYNHAPHSGLKGKSPNQVAAESTAPVLTVDERALDVLLMPAAGKNGRRKVTKFGIRVDHFHYLSASILPGTDVFVRQDPTDMGRVLCFTPDQAEFLGEAICAELAGIHPETWVQAQREMRNQIIAEKTAEMKKTVREIVKGPALHERALEVAARKVPNVIALPKREEKHSTPQIAAALDAMDASEGKRSVPDNAGSFDARVHQLVLEDLTPKASGENVSAIRTGTTPAQRFHRARDLRARMDAGIELLPEEAFWLGSYEGCVEWKVQKALFEDFGDQAPVPSP